MPLSVLLVEDESALREIVQHALGDVGYRVRSETNGNRALEAISNGEFDVLITDIRIPEVSGMELLQFCLKHHPDTAVILITAYASVEQAVAALKLGAYDYLRKPFEVDELLHLVGHLDERRRLRGELTTLRAELGQHPARSRLLGRSKAIYQVRKLVEAVAKGETNVLVTGPSGTGKNLVAQEVHRLGNRSSEQFVTINCAALPESLAESLLFGHEPGSFTGAAQRHQGFFERASGGTLFLDEVGDLSPMAQAKLLQVIQERSFHRVGGNNPIEVDFRLVSATNRPLNESVKLGVFRLDLFYRLNVVEIAIPRLSDRPEDIPVLVEHFLRIHRKKQGKKVRGFSPEAWTRILSHSYPGNVRELENVVEQAVLLCCGEEITPSHLPNTLSGGNKRDALPNESRERRPLKEMMATFEASYIRSMLKELDNNRTKAAQMLGISRKHLWTKMNQLGIVVDEDDERS